MKRKSAHRIIAGSLLIGLTASIATAATGSTPQQASMLVRFIGRLHPLIIHFPIALILTAGLLELVRIVRRRPESSHTAHVCLMIGTFFAVLAVGSGLANEAAEPHGEGTQSVLWWHKWIAICTTVLIIATLTWATLFRNSSGTWRRRVYVAGLLVSMTAMAITGHYGGRMVFGDGYLLNAFKSAPRPVIPDRASVQRPPQGEGTLDSEIDRQAAAALFAPVQQIFADRCYSCHGADKQRANLRLDQFTHDWVLDQTLWVIQPGDAAQSELVRRVNLEDTEPGHMPPRGDRLTAEQIEAITAWINAGAVVAEPMPGEPSDDSIGAVSGEMLPKVGTDRSAVHRG